MSEAKQPEALMLAELLENRYALGHTAQLSAAELRRQHNRITELEAQLEAIGAGGVSPMIAGADRWVSVDVRLPEPGKPVLLDIGKKYPIRAMWAAKHTVEAGDDDTDWAEYVEADDMYYSPEGWYEWNENEETHWSVPDKPIAWSELPAAPSIAGETK